MSATPPFKVVIPARYASTRLPGKPLLMLAGRSLLQRVHERALASGAEEVIVATDDQRIAAAAQAFGASVAMTLATHASGTDRIAEVAQARGWAADTIVVNVQGDEPLLPPALVGQVAALLAAHPSAAIATLFAPIESLEEFLNPNVVKLVADEGGRALYVSRAPSPWPRDAVSESRPAQFAGALRHIGMYAYRAAALRRLSALPPAKLEDTEKLEQLRALANGFEIRVAAACERPGPDVNSPEDVARVAALLA